jgi:glycerol-1-phosphatase
VTLLSRNHDVLLLDLDGTVFRGKAPTPGAVESLTAVDARPLFVTNNASRSAADVAAHLCDLGFTAGGDDVVTSAQTAARLLAEQLPAGSRVLIVGTDSLAAEVAAVGLDPVHDFADQPVAVVQGLSMTLGWPELAEAALAIRAGALWIAANLDFTLPTERGLVPGNGSLVAALRAATGADPQVAGKPGPAMLRDALARGRFHAPLVVGDRLDTDIAAAAAAGLPSLMVLTGVGTADDVVRAQPGMRPTYLGADLRALHSDAGQLTVAPQPAWRVDTAAGAVTLAATGEAAAPDGLCAIRAIAHAVWSAGLEVAGMPIRAADDAAAAALVASGLRRPD